MKIIICAILFAVIDGFEISYSIMKGKIASVILREIEFFIFVILLIEFLKI